ncbi:uncharacterized protein N7525_003872 [Penicillium rubens]|uniref:uncharacterized protein n=1 Tax=Penicillium rubens TaxID=1108849 RepID=UPI002A5A3EB9|nr:uncharacterized protein N7525_003872 [Penicillium rubens]KAJ5838684.1 hypothetical protein N7525_003872 [Penicillium rubens]
MANEQGALGFVGFPMSSMLRQNALEFPALDLCRRDLGNAVETSPYIKLLKLGGSRNTQDTMQEEQ